MEEIEKVLNQKSLVLILAYAPAGLGHLRVTDALYHGLPRGVTPLLLGAQDKAINYIHRAMSLHPWGRIIMEWLQNGWQEHIYDRGYRLLLHSRRRLLYEQIVTILDQRIDVPKTVLVVSTHFGLSHVLAAIKRDLEKEKQIQVFLVVVVTDDSPQRIWYVEEADLTFVPSETTRSKLARYSPDPQAFKNRVIVSSYPVSPLLAQSRPHLKNERKQQIYIEGNQLIHVVIPVSGAAVGLDFNVSVIEGLHELSSQIFFHVVSKATPYTEPFLQRLLEKEYVKLYTSKHDREIVDKYTEVYQKNPVTFEMTKPSEQAFKALINPDQTGGALLLFANPVGRQEYDNLDFLKRHDLIPLTAEQTALWKEAEKDGDMDQELQNTAINWRGVRLPDDSRTAARFIWWGIRHGLFQKMLACRVQPRAGEEHANELGFDGVHIFWQKVAEFLEKNQRM